MTAARCWMCGRPRGPSADGLGSHCRRKLATGYARNPRTVRRSAPADQPTLEDHMPQPTAPRRFHLIRREDETGVSGTGVIVEGLEFTDGTVSLRWLTGTTSTAVYASIDDVQTIHGHGGKTVVMWLDNPMNDAAQASRDAATGSWAELTAWAQQAADDGDRIDPAELLAYMGGLKRRSLAPMREWMRATLANGDDTEAGA